MFKSSIFHFFQVILLLHKNSSLYIIEYDRVYKEEDVNSFHQRLRGSKCYKNEGINFREDSMNWEDIVLKELKSEENLSKVLLKAAAAPEAVKTILKGFSESVVHLDTDTERDFAVY